MPTKVMKKDSISHIYLNKLYAKFKFMQKSSLAYIIRKTNVTFSEGGESMQWIAGLLYVFVYAVPVFFITLFIKLFKSEQKWNRQANEKKDSFREK